MPATITYHPVLLTIRLQTKPNGKSKLIHRAAVVSFPDYVGLDWHDVECSIVLWRRFLIAYKGPSIETDEPIYEEGIASKRAKAKLEAYLKEKLAKLDTSKKVGDKILLFEMPLSGYSVPTVMRKEYTPQLV
jgi:hypothetical protein